MAKAKKKTTKKHINKVTPAVATNDGMLFDKLSAGECFLMNGGLYMKESSDDLQIGVNLATGKYEDCLCGCSVVLVNIAITWTKK